MAADPLTKSTVDDVFNADFSDFDDDPFADKPGLQTTRDDKAVLSPRASLKRKSGDDKENDGLGLDEEVKITKKRKPIAKLDEARLLSEPGIPKLRALSRSGQLTKKLRIKGKGHEFSDTARLLNHFQLWLDNLYPRAKFADALQLVEKAGHSKRMHIMRTEWINEGKPGYKKYDEENTDLLTKDPNLFGEERQTSTVQTASSKATGEQQPDLGLDDDALFIPDANRPSQANHDDEPEDNELDALLAMQNETTTTLPKQGQPQRQDDSEGEDDLDALLAEQESRQSRPPAPIQPTPQMSESNAVNEDEDDLDALLAEQMTRESNSVLTTQNTSHSTIDTTEDSQKADNQSDEEDEHELEALLAQQRIKQAAPPPSLPTPQPTSSPEQSPTATPKASRDNNDISNVTSTAPIFSSSPVPNNPEEMDLDDLDALLASQEEKMNARMREEDVNTPKGSKAGGVEEADDDDDDFLGSPVPNKESQ